MILVLSGAARAAPPTPGDAQREAAEEARKRDGETRCVHGCLRWGKVCNVDPRGVYKCQRRCEKFGEICE